MTDGQADDLKGRAKEATGAVTDDSELKREGQRDQAAGKAKDVIDDAAEKLKGGVERVKDAFASRRR